MKKLTKILFVLMLAIVLCACCSCSLISIFTHTHSVEKVEAVEATCTTEGNISYWKCACGKLFADAEATQVLNKKDVVIPKTEHTPQTIPGVPATCTQDGISDEIVCTVCDTVLQPSLVLPAGHTPVVTKQGQPATCTQDGATDEIKCAVCNTVIQQSQPLPAGHIYSDWVVVAATCTQDGSQTKECTVCHDLVTEVIPALQHDLVHYPAQEATATTFGWEAYEACSRCDYSTKQVIASANSEWGNSIYGYEKFSEKQKQLYDGLVAVCKTFAHSTEDLSPDGEAYKLPKVTFYCSVTEAIDVWHTFNNEYPIFYWLGNSCGIIQYTINDEFDRGELILEVHPDYAQYAVRRQCDQAIEQMYEECRALISSDMSDLVKTYVIHQYIANKIEYAMNNGVPEESSWAHNIVGTAINNKGVCECYSKTFLFLCNKFGVECIFASGLGNNGVEIERHSWNLVKIDGQWYCIDVTWNDGSRTMKYFGNANFWDDHFPGSSVSGAQDFLYELPEISSQNLTVPVLAK